MTVREYLTWAEGQPNGRYELVDGVPHRISPERNVHVLVKGAVFVAFRAAIRSAGLNFVVLTDGPTVVIHEHQSREPDLVVQAAGEFDWQAVTVDSPIVLVEVTSPSTIRTDTADKLIEYFSLASVQHYLLVHPHERKVVHHRRVDGGKIETSILADGLVDLDPPGFSVDVSSFFEDLPPARSN